VPFAGRQRSVFESKFGRDLSQVRLHTGDEADRLSRQMGAHAFTFGPNIGFRAGAFSPGTAAGNSLLAHELTHVAQQGFAPPGNGRDTPLVGRAAKSVQRTPE
jgi:hypothetical protein